MPVLSATDRPWSCYKSNEKPAVNQLSEDSGLCHQIKSLILSSTAFYSVRVPPCISTSKNDLYCKLLRVKKADKFKKKLQFFGDPSDLRSE